MGAAPPEARQRSSITRSAMWSFGGRLGAVLCQFVGTVVLARLLTPAEFGDAAMVQILASFAVLLADAGLGAAIVRFKSVDRSIISTAFWLNALFSATLAAIAVALSVPLAGFFGRSSLEGLFALASLGFLANFGAAHSGLLQRGMKFRALAIVELAAQSIGVLSSVVFASLDFGALSILAGALISAALRSILVIFVAGWQVGFKFCGAAAGEILSFGRGVLGSHVVNFWARNIDNVLVGKFAGATSLGYYDRAYRLVMLPVGQLITPLSRVLYPAYTTLLDDPTALRNMWLKSVRLASAIAFPVGFGLAASAPALVGVLYGANWSSAAFLVTMLALATPPQILVGGLVSGLYQATGKTDLAFKIDAIQAAITVAAIVLGLRWGVDGVAVALLIKTYAAAPISLLPALKTVGVSFRLLERHLRPVWSASMVMFVLTLASLKLVEALAPLLQLGVQVATGASAYLLCLALWGRPLLRDLLRLVRRRG